MIPFIDFHTHQTYNDNEVVFVRNLSQNEWQNFENMERSDILNTFGTVEVRNPDGFGKGVSKFSLGLHPWFLTKENFDFDFNKLTQLIDNKQVVMMGECGLDKLKGENLAFQSEAFAAQTRLAESYNKPVVIHCVKAYYELILLKKKLKPKVPWVLHGFNQNEQILKELLKNDFYISIGAKILRGPSNASSASKCLPFIPLDKLFFETDDTHLPIKNVYEQAAKLLDMDLDILREKIYTNFENILSS
jgi:TatD DNase family protein